MKLLKEMGRWLFILIAAAFFAFLFGCAALRWMAYYGL
jgi:hypothetical protein